MPLSVLFKTLSALGTFLALNTASLWASPDEANETIPPQSRIPSSRPVVGLQCPLTIHSAVSASLHYGQDETYADIKNFNTRSLIESFLAAMQTSLSTAAANQRDEHIKWNERLKKVLILLHKDTQQEKKTEDSSAWAGKQIDKWSFWVTTWKKPDIGALVSRDSSESISLNDSTSASRKSSCDLSSKEWQSQFEKVHQDIVQDVKQTLLNLVKELPQPSEEAQETLV